MSMTNRRPAHAVMEAVLLEQQRARPRTTFERIFGLNVLAPAAKPWYVGALGELEVARALRQLPAGWHTFHAVPIGSAGTDIDHLIVGPAGVFPINTKHHRGSSIWMASHALWVNGQKTTYLGASKVEGRRIAKVLARIGLTTETVRPVICLVSPGKVTIKQRPIDVTVVTSGELLAFLARQPARLDPKMVAKIAKLFDAPATWRPYNPKSDPYPRFQFLQSEVDAARTRRIVWACALFFGTAPAIILLASALAVLAVALRF